MYVRNLIRIQIYVGGLGDMFDVIVFMIMIMIMISVI